MKNVADFVLVRCRDGTVRIVGVEAGHVTAPAKLPLVAAFLSGLPFDPGPLLFGTEVADGAVAILERTVAGEPLVLDWQAVPAIYPEHEILDLFWGAVRDPFSLPDRYLGPPWSDLLTFAVAFECATQTEALLLGEATEPDWRLYSKIRAHVAGILERCRSVRQPGILRFRPRTSRASRHA